MLVFKTKEKAEEKALRWEYLFFLEEMRCADLRVWGKNHFRISVDKMNIFLVLISKTEFKSEFEFGSEFWVLL